MAAATGQGVPIFGYNNDGYFNFNEASEIPLSWLQDVIDDDIMLPPYVHTWTISYGYPENFAGYQNKNTTNPYYGSAQSYIDICENEFAKLAAMGVTIISSAGDDGVCNNSPYCYIDPQNPIGLNNNREQFKYEKDTNCATFMIEVETTNESCIVPNGYSLSMLEGYLMPGTVCVTVYEQCENFIRTLLEMDKTFFPPTNNGKSKCKLNNNIFQFYNASGIEMPLFSFSSNCTCSNILNEFTNGGSILSNNGCSLKVFDYDFNKYGPMFFGDYPATSQYVTSVSSTTAIKINEEENIIEEQILANYFSPGGGFSSFIDRPWYQEEYEDYIQNYIDAEMSNLPPSTSYNRSKRAYPDVAMIGQSLPVVQNGKINSYGTIGSSFSAPLFAGMIALLNNQRLDQNQSSIGNHLWGELS